MIKTKSFVVPSCHRKFVEGKLRWLFVEVCTNDGDETLFDFQDAMRDLLRMVDAWVDAPGLERGP